MSDIFTPPGIHKRRLKLEADNPREVAFAEQWSKEHDRTDLLWWLLTEPCAADDPERIGNDFGLNGPYKLPLGQIQDRDRIVAATVIQWLGSNCGIAFVADALKRCGYSVANEAGFKW